MAPIKRIALNVIATYVRSLYAMGCVILTSCWALRYVMQIAFNVVDRGYNDEC